MFNATFLKSAAAGRSFAKHLTQTPILWPRLVLSQTTSFSSFEALAQRYIDLSRRPAFTQIIGTPIEGKTHSLPHPRSGRFYESPEETQYLIIDLDQELPASMFLGTTYTEEYREQRLTHETIALIAQRVISLVTLPLDTEILNPHSQDPSFPLKILLGTDTIGTLPSVALDSIHAQDLEFVVRLSTKFGVPSDPMEGYRVHIIVPLAEPVRVEDVIHLLSTSPIKLDTSMYGNIVQPIFTAAPIVPSDREEELDPLATTRFDLPRVIYHAPNPAQTKYLSPEFPSRPIDIGSFPSNRRPLSKQTRIIPASELPDKKGAFNRVAATDESLSIRTWLLQSGYTPAQQGRYLSPTSTSGQAGVIEYPDGYLISFHEQDDLLPHRRLLSAYDLHLLSAKRTDQLPRFKALLEQACGQDPTYQSYWERLIKDRTSWMSNSMQPAEVHSIIEGLIEETIFTALSKPKRREINNHIIRTVKRLNNPDLKYTLSDLDSLYVSLRQSYFAEQPSIHPANPDAENAEALMEIAHVYKEQGPGWLMESLNGDQILYFAEDQAAIPYLEELIRQRSASPTQWNDGKLRSTTERARKQLQTISSLPGYHLPQISPYLFAFRRNADSPVRAIDIRTGDIATVTLNQFVLRKLPFTEEEYLKVQNKPTLIAQSHFGAFLKSSFKDNKQYVKHVQDLLATILFQSDRPQVIFALVGVPRSGKSTIKNLLTYLLGEEFTAEMSVSNLGDAFGLAELTSETRLLTLNEFNASIYRASGSNAVNVAVNRLKEISGGDKITVRQMRTNPVSIRTRAVPLLISNEMPTIPDRAFQNRLYPIRFNHSFPEQALLNSDEFQRNLLKELPLVFEWARSHKNMVHSGDITKVNLKPSQIQLVDKDIIFQEMDVVGSFLTRYIEEAPGERVFKQEIYYYYRLYHEKVKGFRPIEDDDHDLNRTFSKTKMRSLFLSSDFCRASTKARSKDPTVPKSTQDAYKNLAGNQAPAFKNVRWKDENQMILELSEFLTASERSDFIQPVNNDDDQSEVFL